MLTYDWLTVKEASQHSGFSTGYVKQLVSEGKISGRKAGWSWLIEKKSLDQYLDMRKSEKMNALTR